MSQITNFSDLQTTSAITTGAQLLSRLANGLSGVDGFARINVLDFQKSLPLYSAYQSASGLAITNITVTAPLITTGGKTPALSISPATTGSAGSMTSADKIKLISLPYTVGTGLSSIKPIFGNNTVTGNRSTVLCGFTNVVTGTDAIVAGSYNTVNSNYALVLGNTNYIDSGYVFGEFNTVTNGGLMAIGSSNTVSNPIGMAIGIDNLAYNPNAIAIGRANTVNADNAWAIGADITNSIYNSMIIGPDSNTNLIIRGDNGRIGLDTTAPISKLQLSNGTISIPSADISNNITLTANSKYLQNYIGSGGNIVILPSCSTGNGLSFIVKNAGTGPVTVVSAGSDTIFASSAVTSITLNVGESGTFTIRSAAQWIVTVSTLSNTGVNAGTYGSSNTISTFTVDSKGRVLSAGNITLPANSSSATVLQTGRTIGMTGDVTWTTPTFNGSSNVTSVGTLSSTGVIAGTYGSSNTISTFTVDSKGRVLSAGNITLPANSSSATVLQTGRTIGMTGDVTWTTPTFDGSSNVTAVGTLSSTGVIAGTYGSLSSIPTFNIDSKGRVLSAGNILLPTTLLPSWDTADDSGSLINPAFSAVWNVSGGTLRIKGSRPISEGFGEIFTFLNSSSLGIGPAIYDNAGVLGVRFRDASANDIVSYNSTARSVPNFDLVINWNTYAASNRHAVWINGVLQVAAADVVGSFATTQNQLRWGSASNLTIDHLAYYTSRSGTPVVLGSAASSPIITQNIVNFENSVQTLAAKLPRFRAAIAATNSGIASAHTHILCAGDSITWGYGSSKQSTIAPAKAYPRILLNSLPNSQQGIANPPISNLYFDNRWTAGTGWSINDNAWSTYQANSPAGYLTYTPDSGAFDRFDVFYLASPGSGLLRGTATGGTLTDIITDQPINIKKATFSCGSVGYTNSISLSSIGGVSVIGIEPWLSTTPTVRVGNVGIFGSFASRWAGNAPWSGSTTWSCLRAVEAYAPHLFIISLGMNEAINSISSAAFETDMSTIISTVKVYADVMLVIPPIAGDGPTDARLATLALVYYRLAATYNLALLDLRIRFTSYSSTWMTDAYHPNDIGYSDIASGVSDILTSSVKIKSLSSTLPLYTIPTYANDNAADADIRLASGSQYKVTNDRTVHIKP